MWQAMDLWDSLPEGVVHKIGMLSIGSWKNTCKNRPLEITK